MIPILYEKGETSFSSNGLGRLRDCISCTVTEQRNGIYECDFEYPVDGANFDKIICGRSIGVTHEESDDIQPFDIVSYERNLDGIVKFHCVHISYRLNGGTLYARGISSLADALTTIEGVDIMGFSFSADFTATGDLGVADGIPRTMREWLGGVEGSILDTYGGEYEFDRFNVILHKSRGETKNFAIRYGVNLLGYEEEMDFSETYSAAVPFWEGSDELVVGNKVDSGETMFNGVGKTVPLDLSSRFDDKPTKAQLTTAATSILNSNPTLPNQTLKVDFLKLADMEEYADFSNLLECKLCDKVRVIIPKYGIDEYFKIVETEYDVLLGRYSAVELGDLSTSLSEALGISESSSSTAPFYDSGREQVSSSVAAESMTDFSISFNKTFVNAPNVVACLGASFSSSSVYAEVDVSVISVTTTGFTLRVSNNSGSSKRPTINWVAIGG